MTDARAARDPVLSNPFGLILAGFRAIRPRLPQAVVLWAVSAGVALGTQALRVGLGDKVMHPGFGGPWLALSALGVLLAAVTATLLLRLFLVDGPGWWRPDRGFWLCTGLLAAGGIGTSLQALTMLGAQGTDPDRMAMSSLLMLVTAVGLYWAYARLALWPVGLLDDPAKMTPGRSWRLMRGYVSALVIGAILIELPLVMATFAYAVAGAGAAVGVATPAALEPSRLWGLTVMTALLGPVGQIVRQAMVTVLYRRLAR